MKIRATQMNRHRSGQIMVEACVGISLLAFVWILISYTSFMTTNRIRTAMAARHAAWRVAKEGVNPQSMSKEINDDFFYNSFATVENGDAPVNRAGSIGVPILTIPLIPLHGFIGDSGPPNRTRVTFGIKPADLNSPNVAYPFNLMNTHLPFMTNSMLAGFLSVNSQCQWPAINDVWSDKPADPMNRFPLSVLKTEGDVINVGFGWWSKVYNSLTYAYWVTTVYVPVCLPCRLHNATVGWLGKKWDCSKPCTPPSDATFGCHP